MTPVISKPFEALKAELSSHRRLCGYYLIELVDITDLRESLENEEQIAESAFKFIDDQEWKPKEKQPNDQQWADYIVDRETARQHVIKGLVGGPEKGHLKATITEEQSAQYFDRFDAFFEEPKNYYIGMGFGNRDFVFSEGVAIISVARAGLLWVVEGD